MSVEPRGTVQNVNKTTTRRLRLGLYDPDPENPIVVYVGKKYPDSPAGRCLIQQSIDKYNRMASREGILDICIGVFEVEA